MYVYTGKEHTLWMEKRILDKEREEGKSLSVEGVAVV